MPVLLTRPETQGARFASMLAEHFGSSLRTIATPLLQPRFIQPVLPDRLFRALILTSETGVAAARRISADHPGLPTLAFCVGETTAEKARAAGFRAQSADGDAEALIRLILSSCDEGPLLHLHGRDTRGNIADTLTSKGLETISAITYAQDPLQLSDEAAGVLCQSGPVLVPLFSPRTAAIFGDRVSELALKATLSVLALSPAVAAAIPSTLAKNVLISAKPTAAAMLDLIQDHISRIQRP